MRQIFGAWSSEVLSRRENCDLVQSTASCSTSSPTHNVPVIPAVSVSASALIQQSPHPSRPSSLLLKYFNAWFKFANVSQWSRDLHEEHEYTRLKTVWALWKGVCKSRRPHPPLSPSAQAAAGVKALMPRSSQRPLRSSLSVQLPDVAVDVLDRPPPTSSVSNVQRPASRQLVSPDDSARLMFFFGPLHSLLSSLIDSSCSLLTHLPFRHVPAAPACGPHMEPARPARNGHVETIRHVCTESCSH
jgi:hypothetical protein